MTTLSTHDTKRAEDVRTRLAVLSEMPAEWGRRVADWHTRARALLSAGADPVDPVTVDPATAYLLWQTVVGAWPLTAERLTAYLTKAMREAKTRTSWITPDEQYENAVRGLAELALEHPELRGSIESFVGSIATDAASNSLGVKLIQLTMPGVPDVYQGCELTALSLVDPDNRRPVDFGRRQELLRAIEAGDAAAAVGDLGPADLALTDLDTAKLLVTSRALRLRREHPDWFLTGGHQPLTASGPAADHVVAFARVKFADSAAIATETANIGRGGAAAAPTAAPVAAAPVAAAAAAVAVTVVTRLPRRLRARGGWDETRLELPSGLMWRDVLTGAVHSSRPLLADLTRQLPVALLIPNPEAP
jgi:(1->4)-alpha-D-glucan 1-alpha-D-glucosylmutase